MKFIHLFHGSQQMPIRLIKIRFLLVFGFGCLVHFGAAWPPGFVPYPHFSGLDEMKHPFLKDCTQRYCPYNWDYNPQCGTDGKTYPNRFSVLCMQVCLSPMGLKMNIAHPGFCEKDKDQEELWNKRPR